MRKSTREFIDGSTADIRYDLARQREDINAIRASSRKPPKPPKQRRTEAERLRGKATKILDDVMGDPTSALVPTMLEVVDRLTVLARDAAELRGS